MIEQRKNQRFDLRLPLEILGKRAKSKLKSETLNVSSSGVLFTSPAPIEVGQPIEYMITLPKASGTRAEVRLRCIGKIIRSESEAAFAATLERYEFVRQRI